MKIPAFTIRQWISLGLCVLGGFPPLFFMATRSKNTIDSYLIFLKPYYLFYWLLPTLLLYLTALYVSQNKEWYLLGWIVVGFGFLISMFSYYLFVSASIS